jgi:hypothetical protein
MEHGPFVVAEDVCMCMRGGGGGGGGVCTVSTTLG